MLETATQMAWFKKAKRQRPVGRERPRSQVPEGLWVKCEGCREIIYSKELEKNLRICPKCGYHFRISARERIELLLDDGRQEELFAGVQSTDPLTFKDSKPYKDRLKSYRKQVGEKSAVIVVKGEMEEIPVVLAVMVYRFMGGSMGSAVGEKITRAIEEAIRTERPLVVVSASGGARMQEGVLSLMQMAKISAALARLRDRPLPFLALIGFAGPRVIQQTIGENLPEGFQRSEFLLQHGFLDMVVQRTELKETLARSLRHLLKTPAKSAQS
jgi:acetyl-CoA carboxylase carboxyl transferase subunit beta